MLTYRGRTALITGASSGIGETFAHTLAARGVNVILVARSADKLYTLAGALARQYGVSAEVIPADLGQPGMAQRIYDITRERQLKVDWLINSAGFGLYGPFETIPPEREQEEIALNIGAAVDMAHAFLPQMLERRDGAIINIASTAALQPVPYMAVYAATKAFLLSFSEALWAEYRRRGVRVLAICPGPVQTAFFETLGSDEWAIWGKLTPQRVVDAGLRGLERGQPSVIVGRRNAFISLGPRIGPRSWVARIAGIIFRPRRRRFLDSHPKKR
jgi:hypothetical protein